jgi:hypothetical protein
MDGHPAGIRTAQPVGSVYTGSHGKPLLAIQAAARRLPTVNCLCQLQVDAAGYQTGFYLCGTAGLGKSYNVLKQFEDLGANYRLFNSPMTAKGLYQALAGAPDAVHVLEDMERLTADRDEQGVLCSALWSQPGHERIVTWTTGDGSMRFSFAGGIIMLANRPLTDLPELRALASRIAVHELAISEVELAAHLRRVAEGGFARDKHQLERDICVEVAGHVLAECRAAGRPPDLRLYDNACLDYLQWEHRHADCHWRDLVANRVRQSVAHFRREAESRPREERLAEERALVREIVKATADGKEQVRRWRERTGKSPAAFYRRKRAVDSGEFD